MDDQVATSKKEQEIYRTHKVIGNFGYQDWDSSSQMILNVNPLQEIATNYLWLKPVAWHFPTTVPGAMLLTDVFL